MGTSCARGQPTRLTRRLENLGELASAAAQYDTLLDFVERMALVADSDNSAAEGGHLTDDLCTSRRVSSFPAS